MNTNASVQINTSNGIKLSRLLQLCSANLPVGGFSFSQGLEFAVDNGWINNSSDTASWIEINLFEAIARTDLAILARLYRAIANDNVSDFQYWDQHLQACRESSELLLADVAMGKALIRLLTNLDRIDEKNYQHFLPGSDISFVSAFALTAYLCELDLTSVQSGYCWTFIDNQVAAATKLVPLGQTQAQNLLFDLTEKVDAAIAVAEKLTDDEIGGSLPHLAMASAWHETQYSRLFRS
ncbi:urease accessory protein UreF [Thalassotalea sp. PLHSN55]|uniref:urease accessory protein UreF n=1 Tax=Thalassotalea sp. PLHSN55 TaxID=3435888 RepID=UPI003F84070D